MAWDRNINKLYLFLDGQEAGSKDLSSDAGPQAYNPSALYDIGLIRNSDFKLKGYLKDLMVIGRAVTEEELVTKITGI